jgi:hypothetical protein
MASVVLHRQTYANRLSRLPRMDSTPSIGNVKGVMLCSRPNVENSSHSGNLRLPPFVLAIAHQEIGQRPFTRARFPHQITKAPNPTTSFKGFLASLQESKRTVLAELVARSKDQETQRERFSARSAAERARIRARSASDAGSRQACPPSQFAARTARIESGNERDRMPDCDGQPAVWSSSGFALPTSDFSIGQDGSISQFGNSLSTSASARDLSCRERPMTSDAFSSVRPAWALTRQQHEEMQEEEVDDVLSFTENLDYDKYMDDLETDETLETLHKRIAQLEADRLVQQQQEQVQQLQHESDQSIYDESGYISCDASERSGNNIKARPSDVDSDTLLAQLRSQAAQLAAKKQRRAAASAFDSVLAESAGGVVSESNSAVHEARALLQSQRSLRGVHSAQSVSAISRQLMAQDRDDALSSGDRRGEGDDHLVAPGTARIGSRVVGPLATTGVQGPMTAAQAVVIADHSEQRVRRMPDPNNLPYLYRNPAI